MLVVQSAQCALGREALVILNKIEVNAPFFKNRGAESLHEVTAVISVKRGLENQNVWDFAFCHFHLRVFFRRL